MTLTWKQTQKDYKTGRPLDFWQAFASDGTPVAAVDFREPKQFAYVECAFLRDLGYPTRFPTLKIAQSWIQYVCEATIAPFRPDFL